MYNRFEYNGEVITDLEQFCKDHNTKMIKVKCITKSPNVFSGKIDTFETIIDMPEIFFNNMRWRSNEQYIRL